MIMKTTSSSVHLEFMTHSASSGACMAQQRRAESSRQGHRHVLCCLWQHNLRHHADHDAMGIHMSCAKAASSEHSLADFDLTCNIINIC